MSRGSSPFFGKVLIMIIFFLLSSLCLLCAILLITNKNPVYSVLSLVLLFVCGSILLLILGVDFLPFVFILVYVGAVAVLFLFVVIILDIKLSTNKDNNLKQISFVLFSSSLAFVFLHYIIKPYKSHFYKYILIFPEDYHEFYHEDYYAYDDESSLSTLGQVLYSEYILHFVICGLVLLVALIGAIVLTSRRRQISLKQKVFKQMERLDSVGKNHVYINEK